MIDDLVSQIETRFGELERQLADPEVIGDRERFRDASRAYRELEPAAKLATEYRRVNDDLEGARELLAEDGDDAELRALLESSRERLAALEDELRLAMVERDPNDDKNVIVEIRPGAGGDEAALWAGDLYRMLTRYAERRGFTVEPLAIGDGSYTFGTKSRPMTRCTSSHRPSCSCWDGSAGSPPRSSCIHAPTPPASCAGTGPSRRMRCARSVGACIS